ncbi:MAG: arylsulfotransferase family protein [Candidatus Limnocylindrales bacterium]
MSGPEWTRRRFLKTGGVAAVGVIALGGVALGVESSGARGRSPAPAPSGSPAPVARRTYRSRPDLTAAPVYVASPLGAVAPGFVFLTPNNGLAPDGLLITDNAGKPIWIRPDTGSHAVDFRVNSYNGKPVLSWWEGTVSGGYGSGQVVLVDDTYTELLRFGAGAGRKADIHEFQITPQQTALLLTDGAVPLLPDATPPPWQNWDCVVEEIDIATGAVLFEWHSADHIQPAECVLPPPSAAASPAPTATGEPKSTMVPTPTAVTGPPIYDSVHVNSIELDTDGNLLVSARNTSTVYKVDRATGQIRWRLGGKNSDFKMGPGATFALQHDARRHPDGTITIFDDGAAPDTSRAIVLNVDESAMTATLVRAYPHPHGKLAGSQGNVQVLPNGNLFVGWGSTGYASEFSVDGALLLDADFSGSIQSYRCYRCPWVATPTTSPALAVDPLSNGQVTAYASWNGATEVAAWELLAGATEASLTSLGTFPRTDFETTLSVKSVAAYLAVRALDSGQAVLGISATVSIPE